MNRKNQQQTEQIKTSSSMNIQPIDLEAWAREVKVQMMAVLDKRKAQRETKNSISSKVFEQDKSR